MFGAIKKEMKGPLGRRSGGAAWSDGTGVSAAVGAKRSVRTARRLARSIPNRPGRVALQVPRGPASGMRRAVRVSSVCYWKSSLLFLGSDAGVRNVAATPERSFQGRA